MFNSIKQYTPTFVKRAIYIIISIPFYVGLILKRPFFYLRWFSSDVHVFYHTFIEKEFAIKEKLKNIEYIIDAGANIGLASLYFHNEYPLAKIIAIEPEENNFKLLVKNTQRINMIFPLKRGVWNSDAFLKINNPDSQSWAFTTREVNEKKNFDVRAISIPTVIKKYNLKRIDLLKIDIEGAESDLFQNNTKEWLSITRIVVIEFHGVHCEQVVKEALEMNHFIHFYQNGENNYFKNSLLN